MKTSICESSRSPKTTECEQEMEHTTSTSSSTNQRSMSMVVLAKYIVENTNEALEFYTVFNSQPLAIASSRQTAV